MWRVIVGCNLLVVMVMDGLACSGCRFQLYSVLSSSLSSSSSSIIRLGFSSEAVVPKAHFTAWLKCCKSIRIDICLSIDISILSQVHPSWDLLKLILVRDPGRHMGRMGPPAAAISSLHAKDLTPCNVRAPVAVGVQAPGSPQIIPVQSLHISLKLHLVSVTGSINGVQSRANICLQSHYWSMQFSVSHTQLAVSQQRSWFGSPPIAHRNEKAPEQRFAPRSMHLALTPAAARTKTKR